MKTLKEYHLVWLREHSNRTEDWLRIRLADGFHIHHVNGNHDDNTPMNLVLMEGEDHLRLHGLDLRKAIKRKPPKTKTKKIKRRQLEKKLELMAALLGLKA